VINGLDKSLFFVAEISGNHHGNLSRCLELISLAKKSGASAVKFQSFSPSKMTLDLDTPDFRVSNDHPLWGGRKLIDLYRETHTPESWFPELFDHSRNLGIIPFSTPFDCESVDFLESLDCSMYKIASLETGDLRLIEKVLQTGKPVLVSTGATHLDEMREIWELSRSLKKENLIFLLCTSSYPSSPMDAHVRRLELLKSEFGGAVGLSDHTLGIGTSLAAISLGAVIIERHFTDSRKNGGLDASFSLEPSEFENLVKEGNSAYQSLGSSDWGISESETESRRLRRSIYISKNVNKGELVDEFNIASIRPGGGLAPKYLKQVLGKKFNDNYQIGTPLRLEQLI
jgi:pseudaminic acid synthase